MGQTSSVPKLELSKAIRELRQAGMDSWARIALKIVSSHTFSRVSAVVAKPALIATGIARKRTGKAMTQLLAHANMPSRSEVLALSVRLTHIETAIDDLAAAVETMRTPAARPPAVAKRAAANDRAPHRTTPPTGPTPPPEG